MKIELITGFLGAEITNLNLHEIFQKENQSQDRFDVYNKIKNLWATHSVLVFRDQCLTDDDFIRFGKIFGAPSKNYFFFPNQVETHPDIAKVIKAPSEKLNTGGIWHHDQSYYPNPVKGISLYGVQIPLSGGDTLFASLTQAFAALSPSMQKFLSNLQVVHTTRLMLAKKTQTPKTSQIYEVLNNMKEEQAIHPLVCIDPLTQKPFLYLNRTTTESILGVSPRESSHLLDFLFQHIERHEFTCRVKWKKGTLVLWNNHSCLHYAINDYSEMRELHRIHFLQEAPISWAPPTTKGEISNGI